ncbi:MAG: hypothetical protein WB723_17060 [Candidatus Acidiferrales bacterium]
MLRLTSHNFLETVVRIVFGGGTLGGFISAWNIGVGKSGTS